MMFIFPVLSTFAINYMFLENFYMSTDLIAGDLNGDERVDSFDVVLCRQEIVNVQNDSEVNVLADIDKNGKVQVNDLVLIANFVLGKKTYIS